MRIKCEPGTVVDLGDGRTSSVKGGEYEATEKAGKAALKRKGVTDVTKTPAKQKGAQNAN